MQVQDAGFVVASCKLTRFLFIPESNIANKHHRCTVSWSVGLYLVFTGIKGSSNAWKFGTVTATALIDFTTRHSVLSNVMIANIAQLMISFLYLMYNGLFTCMLLASEYTQFSVHRKPLRVSAPKGQQRSTYYLELPYRYAVPLLIVSGLLHWLVSESIFLARIRVFDHEVPVDEIATAGPSINACGYSVMALVLVLTLSGVMMITLWGSGFVKANGAMPIVSSCSVAISAACHRIPDDVDAAVMPLKWGVVDTENSDVGHATFSSREVGPLVPGQLYA